MAWKVSHKVPMLAAIGAAALAWSAGGALAQARLGQTQLTDVPPPPVDVRMVDGKVVDLERRPDMVTMLRLDDGSSLAVPPEGEGPGERAKVGDSIVARYTESGTGRVAMQVRVIETQSP
jgi:hypothetical protein